MSSIEKIRPLRARWTSGTNEDSAKVVFRFDIERPDDVKERVACALSVGSNGLTIGRIGHSPSGLAARCTGEWKGRRFFAKILLADPYPIPDRFNVPWESSSTSVAPVRQVSEQIEVEWEMTRKMRALAGGNFVPEPLGMSIPARTIVWEEACGVRLDRAVKWSRWKRSFAEQGIHAMLQAGMWLRRVHDASDAGTEAVDMSVIISRASEFARENRPNISDYERAVPKVLEAAVSEIGSVFHVPVAFTHGDFCLSNLISESANGRVAIIDFELCKVRPVYHDLFALLSELYSQFLNPLVPKSVIQSWEKAFWEGYGPASTEIKAFARALALARIFYHDLYRLLTRRKRKGWIAGLNAQLYRMLLEPIVLTRRLDLPPEICPL